MSTSEPQIRMLTSEPIKVIDTHFGMTRARPLPPILPTTVERYLLEDLSLIVNFFGGRDFSDDDISSEKDFDKEFEHKLDLEYGGDHRVRFAEDGTVHLWESLDLMSSPGMFSKAGPSSTSSGGKESKSKGGRHRQTDVCVQLYLSKIKSLYETFEPTFSLSWRFVLMINEIEIRDRVQTSKINKMLYEYCSESMPRRNNANMLLIKATTSKNSADSNDECDLKISVKPLRINIDQDTLMFLVDFFAAVNPKVATKDPVKERDRSNERRASNSSNVSDTQYVSAVADNLNNDIASSPEKADMKNDENADRLSIASSASSKPSALYVKSFVFSPDVPIRLDYAGKRVDLEQVLFTISL